MPITFILFNGPPRSGKSVCARDLGIALREFGKSVMSDSFAAPMKHYIATALAETYADMDKDKPRAELSGYSVRRFLIAESEEHMKPVYGKDVFGRLLYHRVLRYTPPPDYVIIDDSGFRHEADALGGLGDRKVMVKMVRPGYDYTGDSRTYWHHGYDFIFNNTGDDTFRRVTVSVLARGLV